MDYFGLHMEFGCRNNHKPRDEEIQAASGTEALHKVLCKKLQVLWRIERDCS